MNNINSIDTGRSLDFDLSTFEIDEFGRYDVEDADMLDVVAGGWGNSGCQTQNSGCNGNCGCTQYP